MILLSETSFSVLRWAPGLPPPLPLSLLLLLERQFCLTSDTLPWVIEPDVESQSGDALLNTWHLVQIWRGLHYRYCLTSFSIPGSPWGISSSVRVSVCFSSASPPNSPACVKVDLCVGIRVTKCWNMMPIIPLLLWFVGIFRTERIETGLKFNRRHLLRWEKKKKNTTK